MKKVLFRFFLALLVLTGCSTRDEVYQTPAGERQVSIQNWTPYDIIVVNDEFQKTLTYNEVVTFQQKGGVNHQVPALKIKIVWRNIEKTILLPPEPVSTHLYGNHIWFKYVENKKGTDIVEL